MLEFRDVESCFVKSKFDFCVELPTFTYVKIKTRNDKIKRPNDTSSSTRRHSSCLCTDAAPLHSP